jgi:glycosyltransferase involved in cell wall biosynthesis
MSLTAIILTHNEEQHLPECLASVRWADQVMVFDSFSTDRTLEIAKAAGVKVLQREFDNYSGQRNVALLLTQTEWVLFVDADERVPPALADEIKQVVDTPQAAQAGWWIPRHNYLFGKLTLHAGWYPDYQLRLLRRANAHYERPVHEIVVLEGEAGHLKNPLIHLNYATVPEFVAKQKNYAAYAAERLAADGVRAKPQNFILQPLRQFWWRFITLRGWRDGIHGLRLSLLMASFEIEKYRQLRKFQVSSSKFQG